MAQNYLQNIKKELFRKYNFLNWFLGNVFVSLGICLSTKSDFGLSMIAAPPYILHVWLRDSFPFFTQGTAEYFFEAIILIITCIVIKQFRFRYLLSFGEAVIAGLFIDAWLALFGGNGAYASMSIRILALVLGIIISAIGVAFFFRTTLPLQTYELSVVEIASAYKIDRHKVKQVFDISLLVLSLFLSFVITGKLTGIGIGTFIIVIVNTRVIRFAGSLIDRFEK